MENSKQQVRTKRGNLKWILLGAGVAVSILLGVVVGTIFTKNKNSSSPEASENTNLVGLCESEESTNIDFGGRARRLQIDSYQSIGCFQTEMSLDFIPLVDDSVSGRVDECSQHCVTNFFGVTGDNICHCFIESPAERLALGSCSSVGPCDVSTENRMEVYFDPKFDPECNQELTSSVRNFLVEEDDSPFGFDLVSNTFKQSPFELYKDQCGTNMYEVQTEISEGSKQMQTSRQSVEEFASETRSQLSQSISYGVSASYTSALASVSASVSGSNDREQISVFKSSGANSQDSSVFTSIGVKRIAEVSIQDFDNKKHFVTFSPQFTSLLRAYRQSEYSKSVAEQIIGTYGHTALIRGMFGGYMQLRSTAAGSNVDRFFSSEEQSSECYEVAVEAEAGYAGFRVAAEAGSSGCTDEALSEFNRLRQSFQSSSTEQEIVGGGVVDGEFVVPADQSTLLTTRDKYPADDKGMQVRLLSDFLEPSRISPLEFRRAQITESQFETMKSSLQAHIIESLEEKAAILGQCGDCPVPYLEQNENGQFECQCHDPALRTSFPTYAPTKAPTMSPTRAPRMTIKNIRMRSGDHWGLSSLENIKPTIRIHGKNYYPSGNRYTHVPQNHWTEFPNFSINNLLPGDLFLTMDVHGHGSPYRWTITADKWFRPMEDFKTEGQDTNNNKKYLMWEFDVVES